MWKIQKIKYVNRTYFSNLYWLHCSHCLKVIFSCGIHLYMSLFPSIHPSIPLFVHPMHTIILTTMHHLIIIFGTHMHDISRPFFLFSFFFNFHTTIFNTTFDLFSYQVCSILILQKCLKTSVSLLNAVTYLDKQVLYNGK